MSTLGSIDPGESSDHTHATPDAVPRYRWHKMGKPPFDSDGELVMWEDHYRFVAGLRAELVAERDQLVSQLEQRLAGWKDRAWKAEIAVKELSHTDPPSEEGACAPPLGYDEYVRRAEQAEAQNNLLEAALRDARMLLFHDADVRVETKSLPAEFAVHAWIMRCKKLLGETGEAQH